MQRTEAWLGSVANYEPCHVRPQQSFILRAPSWNINTWEFMLSIIWWWQIFTPSPNHLRHYHSGMTKKMIVLGKHAKLYTWKIFATKDIWRHIQLNLGNEFSTFLFSLPTWHIQLILICNGVLFAVSISVSMILSLMSILVQWPTNCEQESFCWLRLRGGIRCPPEYPGSGHYHWSLAITAGSWAAQ